MAIQEQSPRRTIEEQGSQWATKQEVSIREGQEKILPFIANKNLKHLEHPRLVAEDDHGEVRQRLGEDLRLGPAGEIYTTVWKPLTTGIAPDNRRTLVFPQNKRRSQDNQIDPLMYASLSTNLDIIEPDPEDLPRNGKVIELVFNRVWDGLEPAIRQQGHILHEYDPFNEYSEPQKMHKIALWTSRTATELSQGSISKERLDELAEDATSLLGASGLYNAQNETKQKIVTMITNAAGLDSLGRVNPTVSRIRLRSGMLATRNRIVVSDLIRQKSNANAEVLVAVRNSIRLDLNYAREELSEMSETARLLEKIPGLITNEERMKLAANAHEIALTYLQYPRVAPYLLYSQMAAHLLVGIWPEDGEINRDALGPETADDIYDFDPAVKLLQSEKEENHKIAGSRIRWAKTIIDSVLNDPDYEKITPTRKNKKSDLGTSE